MFDLLKKKTFWAILFLSYFLKKCAICGPIEIFKPTKLRNFNSSTH